MNCEEFKQIAALAAIGCASPAETEAVEMHCVHCPSCDEAWHQYKRLATANSEASTEIRETHFVTRPHRSARPVRWSLPRLTLVPLGTAIALLILFRSANQPHRKPSHEPAAAGNAIALSSANTPQLSQYRTFASHPNEAGFDAALNRDADRLLPTTEQTEATIAKLRSKL